MFNPETNRSEDVSHGVAQEILRRLGIEGRSVPSALEEFIDRHEPGSAADPATGAGVKV